MLPKTVEFSEKEVHTLGELCLNLFKIKVEVAGYTHSQLTQATIDALPQMVRLANEKMIIELGLKPKIGEKFRAQAEFNKSLETTMEEGSYYAALEGGVPTDLLGKKAK